MHTSAHMHACMWAHMRAHTHTLTLLKVNFRNWQTIIKLYLWSDQGEIKSYCHSGQANYTNSPFSESPLLTATIFTLLPLSGPKREWNLCPQSCVPSKRERQCLSLFNLAPAQRGKGYICGVRVLLMNGEDCTEEMRSCFLCKGQEEENLLVGKLSRLILLMLRVWLITIFSSRKSISPRLN